MIVRATIEGICVGVEPKMEYVDGARTDRQAFRDGLPLWSVSVLGENERFAQRVTIAAKAAPGLLFGQRIIFPDAECSTAWVRASRVENAGVSAEDFE